MAEITPNKEYADYAPRWKRVRDIDDGEYRLKQNDLACISTTADTGRPSASYLRVIKPGDNSTYNIGVNRSYINGGRLYNATARTAKGLLGMAFRVDPTPPDLPTDLQYLSSNANGAGMDMDQMAKATTDNVIKIGRDGLLCDMPRNEDGSEVTAQMVADGFRPRMLRYSAESIVDWHESLINGAMQVDLVVLREVVQEFTNKLMIERDDVTIYKVYRLTVTGVTVETLKEYEGNFTRDGEAVPVVGANNTALKEIPFVFVGSMNNQPCVDGLPIEDIANINIGHYQESANLSASAFNVSAVTPWIADDGYQRAARTAGNDDEVELGENSMIILGSGGTFNLAQPDANTMSQGMMTDYENQMVALGAQLVTSSSGNETAEAARIKHSSDVSVLDIIAGNVSDAYSKMIYYAGLFLGVTISEDLRYELNRNFFDSKLTAQELDAMIRTWQAGAISKEVLDK
ncbi:DUF4055 domain-containing protein, partial [bacterium]|nr:DUF4055 domain-containing protein [bacterium]